MFPSVVCLILPGQVQLRNFLKLNLRTNVTHILVEHFTKVLDFPNLESMKVFKPSQDLEFYKSSVRNKIHCKMIPQTMQEECNMPVDMHGYIRTGQPSHLKLKKIELVLHFRFIRNWTVYSRPQDEPQKDIDNSLVCRHLRHC